MANETLVTAQWLHSTLSTDATLIALLPDGAAGIYQDKAPQGARFPYVLFAMLDPGQVLDTTGPSQEVIWVDSVWLIKGVAQASSYGGTLESIASRLAALLNKRAGTVSRGEVWSCRLNRPLQMAETGPGGEQYRHLGATYRIKSKGA